MFKKLITFVVAAVLLVQTAVTPVYATPEVDVNLNSTQLTMIESNLKDILSNKTYSQNNVSGALSNLAMITNYSMNLSILINSTGWRVNGGTEEVGVSADDKQFLPESVTTVDYYIDALIDMLNNYYTNYDSIVFNLDDEREKVTTPILKANTNLSDSWYVKTGINEACKGVSVSLGHNYSVKDSNTRNLVVQWIQGYDNQKIDDSTLTGRVAQILRELTCTLAVGYSSEDAVDYVKMKEECGNIMYRTFLLYDTTYSNALDLYAIGTGTSSSYDNTSLFYSNTVNYALQYTQQYSTATLPLMSDIITEDFIRTFLLYGEEMNNSNAASGVTVDTGMKYVENLADVTVDSKKQIMKVEGDAKLKNFYYAAFSASSVYIPFSSYTGNTEFSKALSSLVDKDKDTDVALSLYYNTKNLKKPLYYRAIDEEGEPTGVASLYTLGQLRDDIENGRSGSLVTILGEFGKLQSGEWAYAQCEDAIEGADGSVKIPYTSLGDLDYITGEEAQDETMGTLSDSIDSLTKQIQEAFGGAKDTVESGIDQAATSFNTLNYSDIDVSDVPEDLLNELKDEDKDFYSNLVSGKNKVKSYTSTSKSSKRVIKYSFEDESGVQQYTGTATGKGGWRTVYNVVSPADMYDWTYEIEKSTIGSSSSNTGGTGNGNANSSSNTGGTGNGSTTNNNSSGTSSGGHRPGQGTTNPSPKRSLSGMKEALKDAFGIETVYADVDAGFGDASDGENENSETVEYNDRTYTYAYGTVSDINVMSNPVLMYSTSYRRDIDNMTAVLLANVLKSTSGAFTLRNLEDEYLYVNIYGDIVLGDDLVILPGAANPIYFGDDTYNPFTAAFINSYPTVLKNTTAFRLASKNDIGKFLIMGNYDAQSNSVSDYVATKITSIESVAPNSTLAFSHMSTTFTANNGLDKVRVFRTKKLLFSDGTAKYKDYLSGLEDGSDTSGDNLVTGDPISFVEYMPLLYNAAITVNGKNVFPYTPDDDTEGDIASALAGNMYDYVIGGTVNDGNTSSRLLDSYIIENLVVNIIRGNVNASGYQDDVLLTYQEYTANTLGRALDKMKSISKSLLDQANSVSGVIGFKSIYDNAIVATVFNFLRDNWVFFLILIVVVLTFFYIKTRISLFQFIMFGLSFAVASYFYVVNLPDILPGAFNLIINNVADNLSYEILGLDAESYSLSDDKHLALNADGTLNFESSSANIYKFAGSKHRELIRSFNVKSSEITGGNIAMVNSNAGIYVKNDALCVNLDTLFDTLVFEGSTSLNGTYTITAKKTVSNNIDYYTPYYQIVDALLGKVNSLATIYAIPRRTSTYNNNVIRNNYMLYSYVNSKPFVSPGNYSFVEPTAEMEYTDEERKAFVSQAVETANKLEATFGSNADWLGLSGILKAVPDNKDYQSTLWAQTLQDNGYYNSSWQITADNKAKLDDLVTYVNYQTKKFVIDMSNQIGSLSDDTMIKLVALRATIALNQEASDFGHWLYPYSLNYSDMTLNNVLQAVIISDYNKYVSLKLDTVDYVMDEYGWFTLIVFDIATILTFLVAEVINLCVPLFYMLFAALCIFRLFGGQGLKDAMKGYLKASVIVFICGTLLTLELIAAKAMGGHAITIYFIVAADVAILYVLLNMIISVVKGWTDFGNQQINVTVKNKVQGFGSLGKSMRHRSIRTSSLLYNRSGNLNNHRKEFDRYGLDTSVEDYYDTMYHDDYYDLGYGRDEVITKRDKDLHRTEQIVDDIEDIDVYINGAESSVDSINDPDDDSIDSI